jgi:hypothetical protein
MAQSESAPAICGATKNFDEPARYATCQRLPGHYGAHADGRHGDEPLTWSSAPPLGPKPVRLLGTFEEVLAELVICGRKLGRLEHEIGARKHWRQVLETAYRMFTVRPEQMPPEADWARVGQYLLPLVRATADAPQSEPDAPIQERATELFALAMRDEPRPTLLQAARGAWRIGRHVVRTAFEAAKLARDFEQRRVWPYPTRNATTYNTWRRDGEGLVRGPGAVRAAPDSCAGSSSSSSSVTGACGGGAATK